MEHSEATGNYYLINHLTLITGLSVRTIRSYLANGILKGEKINGLWHFTPEAVDAFLHHPSVVPSIQAKQSAVVYDFMLDRKKNQPEACLILDLPGHDATSAAEFFCNSITNDGYQHIRFSYNHTAGAPRIILRGAYRDLQRLVQAYYDRIGE